MLLCFGLNESITFDDTLVKQPQSEFRGLNSAANEQHPTTPNRNRVFGKSGRTNQSLSIYSEAKALYLKAVCTSLELQILRPPDELGAIHVHYGQENRTPARVVRHPCFSGIRLQPDGSSRPVGASGQCGVRRGLDVGLDLHILHLADNPSRALV